jgi:transposase-like protein
MKGLHLLTMPFMQTPPYPKFLRARWYLQVEKGKKPVKEVCQIFGVSRKTYYKWYRFDHDLRIGSRDPKKKRQPNTKLTKDVCELIRKEKLRTNYGPLKMRLLLRRRLGLAISSTIIYRFYKRHKLIRRPQKRIPWFRPLRRKLVPTKAGEVVQADAKYVWLHGRRQYQRTFVDIFTGFHHAIITDTLEAEDTIRAFEEAEKVFPFPILGVQSDNGSENRGTFHQYLGGRGIAHYFVPKNSPNWQGAVERAHGVIDQEFYLNPLRPWKTLAEYLSWYNAERIHLGKYLKGLTPMEKFLTTKTPHPQVSPFTVN